jgi:RNA polymerase sigma factor (sigma-70 family)
MGRLDEVLNKASPTQEDHDWFETNYPPVRKAVRKHIKMELGDHYYALDDVEQVVMLRVWLTGRDKFKPDRSSFKTWAKQVGASEAAQFIRAEKEKAKTQRATFGQLKLRWLVQQHEDIWAHTRWTFQEIMDCLKPEHQEVLLLRVYYQMSASATALTLGKRRATVDATYEEALQEARRWIENDEDVRGVPGGEDAPGVLPDGYFGRPEREVSELLEGLR